MKVNFNGETLLVKVSVLKDRLFHIKEIQRKFRDNWNLLEMDKKQDADIMELVLMANGYEVSDSQPKAVEFEKGNLRIKVTWNETFKQSLEQFKK